MRVLLPLIAVLIVFVASQIVAAQDICTRVSQIKVLPFKGESGLDVNYDALMHAGKSAMPCLIRTVTDTRRMRDPRSEPGYPGIHVKVGDVAYFVLADIAKTDFVFLLPLRVQRQWKASGVWAYFNFVQRKSNREWLQRRLKTWYQTQPTTGAYNNALQLTARQHVSQVALFLQLEC